MRIRGGLNLSLSLRPLPDDRRRQRSTARSPCARSIVPFAPSHHDHPSPRRASAPAGPQRPGGSRPQQPGGKPNHPPCSGQRPEAMRQNADCRGSSGLAMLRPRTRRRPRWTTRHRVSQARSTHRRAPAPTVSTPRARSLIIGSPSAPSEVPQEASPPHPRSIGPRRRSALLPLVLLVQPALPELHGLFSTP